MRADKSVEIELFQIRLAEGVADDDAVIQRVGIVLDGLDQLGIVLVGERGRQNEKHVAGLFFALFFALRQAVVQLLSASSATSCEVAFFMVQTLLFNNILLIL